MSILAQNQKIIQEQSIILEQKYNSLNIEKEKIKQIKKEFETLNSANENSELLANSNYYSYVVLLFVTILLVFLLIKYSITGQQIGGGNNFNKEAFFLFSLMLIALSLVKFFNNFGNYIVISICVIIYIIVKLKLNQ